MKVEVLGMGCPKCKILAELAEKAVTESGVPVQVVKVENLEQIINYGVMVTPALVVNGTVKCAGKIPSKDEIVKWIKEE